VGMVPALIADCEAERARDREAAAVVSAPKFEELADAWLLHRVTVGGIKRTTRNDYESMLRRPDSARSAASSSSAVLPIPDSPTSARTALSPERARSRASRISRRSLSRPTNMGRF